MPLHSFAKLPQSIAAVSPVISCMITDTQVNSKTSNYVAHNCLDRNPQMRWNNGVSKLRIITIRPPLGIPELDLK